MLSQICALSFGWFVASTLLVLQVFLPVKVDGLSIHSIEVPAAVMNSSQVTLVCNYSLENDEQLYSIKWYKNYVEFYRFQPLQAYYSSSSADQSQADNQQHSKQEFELDGISLNLSKSNATHVFLKQTNLASEGTYKCEVSADSPSFATVSIERKMKVYILPKQKLSIIDNNLATNQQYNLHNYKPQQSIKQPINYHLNDVVNLTCVSAHSRPGAKLTWFINDIPVINSSRWLTHHQQPQIQPQPQQHHHQHPSKSMLNKQEEEEQQQQHQLIESRLTLTFKIQSNHLSREANSFQSQQRHQALQIKCLAMLSVEFDSDTVISVLGEKKTLNNKRNRNSQIAARLSSTDNVQVTPLLPSVSRLRSNSAQSSLNEEQEEKLKATSVIHQTIHNASSSTNNLSNNLEYSEYRWPQQTESLQKLPSSSYFSNPWIKSPVTTSPTSNTPNNQDSEFSMTDVNPGSRLSNNNRASIRQSSSSSSPGIMAPIMWTNRQIKLQSEFIDQKLQFTRSNELDTPTIEARLVQDLPTDSSNDDSNSKTSSQTDNSDISATSAIDDNFTGEPEARTTFNRAPLSETPSSNLAPDLEDQNYELNDLVQFTCIPRVALSDRIDIRKKIYSKWFINNKEINAKQINSFDGSKFYHTRDIIQPDSSHSNSSRQNSTIQYPNKAKKPYQAEPIYLLVEFTPSLFQTKEFNLKCRTIVEQPLIEFEQQLTITAPSTVPSNQHPYIQAVDQKQRNPNVRNQSGSNNRQNKRRDRNRDGLAQPLPSSSGTIRLLTIDGSEFKPIIILMIYSLALNNYFSIIPVNIIH